MEQSIYFFWDTVAEMIVSPLMLSPHPAPVIRHFYDSLANPENPMAKHPADYECRKSGVMQPDGYISQAMVETVTTGKVWLATQTQS